MLVMNESITKPLICLLSVGLLLSSCAPSLRFTGGNVGHLSTQAQSSIALDLFNSSVDLFKNKDNLITIITTNIGEQVYANALRQAGFAVQTVGKRSDVKLDFYTIESAEYVGVVTVKQRRVIRRYAEENNTIIALGTSVAWPGVQRQ